jgi:hypothetical protein
MFWHVQTCCRASEGLSEWTFPLETLMLCLWCTEIPKVKSPVTIFLKGVLPATLLKYLSKLIFSYKFLTNTVPVINLNSNNSVSCCELNRVIKNCLWTYSTLTTYFKVITSSSGHNTYIYLFCRIGNCNVCIFFDKAPVYIKIKNILKINKLLNEVSDS